MTANASTGAAEDQPLPSDVNLKSLFWFGRARNYPIFSATWYRYRCLSMLIVVLALAVFLALAMTLQGNFPLTDVALSMASFVAQVAAYFAIGPGLAVLVRAKGWQPRKELIGLCCALALGGALSLGIDKGLVYASEVSGLTERFAAYETARSGRPPSSKAADSAIQNTLSAVFLLWLGGGLDVILYLRQRRRLADSAQRQALLDAQSARREVELRLSVLTAQIEPHFLFNALAGVRSAIVVDPQRATAIVDHLVDYLRATIPRIRADGGSVQARLDVQLEAARSYLALMQARIQRLSFAIESAPELARATLPPLILISLVENAIKHGIEPKIGPAHILVSARTGSPDPEGEMLELTVADDGVGFGGTTSGTGIGLANISERLEALYGKRAALVLKARPEGGVAATIRLPLILSTDQQ